MRFAIALALAAILVTPTAVRADDVVYAGGRILAADGKTPLADAAIAVYDEKGKVIAHGKTDAAGRYSLAVPRGALHLSKKRGGGFSLGGILKGAGSLLNVAAGVAPMALGGFGGLPGLGGGGALSAVTGLAGGGNPLGGLGGLAGKLPGGVALPNGANMKKMMEAMQKAGAQGGMSDELMRSLMSAHGDGMDDEFGADAPSPNSPGALVFRVTCSGYNEVGGVGQIYWMQDETVQDNGKDKARSVAWVDPICLAKDGDSLPSRIVRGYFAFADSGIEPAIVEMGQTVTIFAKLPLPEEPKVDLVVLARNAKTGEAWELSLGADGVYKAEIPVDKKFAKNDQTISILAYPRAGTEGRSKKAEDAIKGAGLWKLDKRFEYNPRIIASRNRADLRLTVVEPAK